MFCCSLSFCNSVAVLFIFLLSHCHCSLFLLSHCSAVHFPSATVLHYCSFFLLDTTATFFLDSQTHCIVIQIQLYWSLKKCTEAWIKNILKSVSQNLHVKFVATSKEQESYKFSSFIAILNLCNCTATVFQLSSATTDEVERQQALQTKVKEHQAILCNVQLIKLLLVSGLCDSDLLS